MIKNMTRATYDVVTELAEDLDELVAAINSREVVHSFDSDEAAYEAMLDNQTYLRDDFEG